jgi:putative membrane protein
LSEDIATEAPYVEGERTHVLGLFVSFITGLPQLFFPIVAAIFGTGSRNNPGLIPIVIIGVMFLSLFFRWIAWLRFRFHLDEDDIRIERGILNRTVRSIPYDRIQDVSIEQKPLARLFDLGEVKFETGGGEGEDAKLSFVSMDRAEALRETIRARKADGGVVVVEEEADERPPVFAMDNRRLVTLGLYSFSLVIFAVLGGLAQQFDFLLPYDVWDFKHWIGMAEERGVSVDRIAVGAGMAGAIFALLALIAIGFASGIIRTFLREYGFRLDRTERGFRRRRGLLTKTDVVMPVNRVQAAGIVTGPIRKRRGWYALKFVSLAQDSKEEADMMVAPLARLDEIWPIMAEAKLVPPGDELEFAGARGGPWLDQWLIALGFLAVGALSLWFALDLVAWWLAFIGLALGLTFWLDWKHHSHAEDPAQLFARHGWWRQRLDIARQVNVQSVTISQGPLTRRRGLATLHFGIAGGSLDVVAVPLEQARQIRDAVMAIVAPVDFSELNRRD